MKNKSKIGFYNNEKMLVPVLEQSGPKPGYYWIGLTFRINPTLIDGFILEMNKILTRNKNRIWEKNIDSILYDTRKFKIPSPIRRQFRSMVESKNIVFGVIPDELCNNKV